MTVPVLQVDGLTVALPRGADRREAVSDVSFEIPPGQLRVSGRRIRIRQVDHRAHGDGADAPEYPRDRRRGPAERRGAAARDAASACVQLRGDTMSMIFQEPMTALNPVMTCGSQIDELLVQHTPDVSRASAGPAFWRFSATCGLRTRSVCIAVIRTSCRAASASGS